MDSTGCASDIAPKGYAVINAPRLDGHRGGGDGGLAVIYRENLKVTTLPHKPTPTTFDVLVVKFGFYLPTSTDQQIQIVTFVFNELSDLENTLSVAGGHPVYVGDFNCSGSSMSDVDTCMFTWLSCGGQL